MKTLSDGLNLIITVFGIGGLAIWGNNQFNELKDGFNKSETQVAVIEEQILTFKNDIKRFEEVRDDFLAIERRLNEQDKAIASSSQSVSNEIKEQTARINEKVAKLEAAITQEVGSGVTIRKVECIPLGERIVVEAGKSYDFCDSKWTIPISSIGKDWVTFPNASMSVPSTYEAKSDKTFIIKGCKLEALEIFQAEEPNENKVEIRGTC